MVKAVIFDLDNTLIDFVRFKKTCIDAAIDGMIHAGLDMEKEKVKQKIMEIYNETFWEDPKIFQKFLKRTIGEVDYKLLAAGIVAYRRARPNVMESYPGVEPTLEKIKNMGLKLGIVSDAPKIKAWLRLTYIDMVDYFDAVLAYEDTGKKKPHEKPFKAAMKILGVKPKQVLFVGDHPKKDIRGANKLGIKTVLGRYGMWKGFKIPKNPGKHEKPDYVVNNIKEVVEIVKSLK